MNREIEFRGKRLDNGEWLYGDLTHDNQGGCYIYPIDAENLYVENKVDPDTVGQFTGMLDKDGMKIFEGDILELVVTYQGKPVGEPRIRKVVWKGSGLYIVNKHNDCVCERSATCQEEEYRVIGNIHNNPELLSTK